MEIFSMVLSLLSGVALFLFGMSLMGDGLKQVAGNKLEALRYDETETGDRYHHGSQYRYQYHRMDLMSFLY